MSHATSGLRRNAKRSIGRRWGVVLAGSGAAILSATLCAPLPAEDVPATPDPVVPQAIVLEDLVVETGVFVTDERVFGRIKRQASSKRGYGPEQLEGPPDVPAAGDNPLSWASASADGQPEWLICEYKTPVKPRAFAVHENYAPGALIKLTVFDPEGKEVIAWEGEDPTPRSSQRGISLIPVRLEFPVQKIKLYLDSQAVPNWNEIDAVGLEDVDGNTHWVVKADASTTYASPNSTPNSNAKRSYGPEQATGEPDTFGPGDQSTAWASASSDAQAEWMLLGFEKPQNPAEIVVYENNAPGGITKVTVFDPKGKEVVAWEGTDPTPRTEPWGVSVFPVKLEFPINKVKLYIDSVAVRGYNEVDAVGLRAANGDTQWAATASASTTYGVQTAQPELMEMPAPNNQIKELAEELKRLKEQVEELKKQLEEKTK